MWKWGAPTRSLRSFPTFVFVFTSIKCLESRKSKSLSCLFTTQITAITPGILICLNLCRNVLRRCHASQPQLDSPGEIRRRVPHILRVEDDQEYADEDNEDHALLEGRRFVDAVVLLAEPSQHPVYLRDPQKRPAVFVHHLTYIWGMRSGFGAERWIWHYPN